MSRFREEPSRGRASRRAAALTVRSAGRTVLFSALTVAAALAPLLVFPQNFLKSTGAAGMGVPFAATLVSLSVLPALLALLGRRVDALTPRRLVRREPSDAELPRTRWYRLTRGVLRRPRDGRAGHDRRAAGRRRPVPVGRANWWAPAWLRRVHRAVGLREDAAPRTEREATA